MRPKTAACGRYDNCSHFPSHCPPALCVCKLQQDLPPPGILLGLTSACWSRCGCCHRRCWCGRCGTGVMLLLPAPSHHTQKHTSHKLGPQTPRASFRCAHGPHPHPSPPHSHIDVSLVLAARVLVSCFCPLDHGLRVSFFYSQAPLGPPTSWRALVLLVSTSWCVF